MEKRVVLMPHHKAKPDAEQIADDGYVMFEWEASMADLLTYGIHITSDGKRIDTFDFYIEPQEPNMQTPLERAARAAIEAERGMRGIDLGSPLWGKEVARAVLLAIREPSPEMIEAGERVPWNDDDGPESTPVWQAMLDTALKDE